MDIRNDGGFAIAPPSYQIIDGQKVEYQLINQNKAQNIPPEFVEFVSEILEANSKK